VTAPYRARRGDEFRGRPSSDWKTSRKEGAVALNLNNVMLGSEDSRRLADFYTKVLGVANPEWSDETGGWFGFRAGDGSLAIGPHSEVKGRAQEPGRIMLNFSTTDVTGEFERIRSIGAEVVAEPYEPGGGSGMHLCTFADPDGNYFQLSPPWNPDAG
jgi:predicted enzyme related to lactoylglutathione lyase